MTATPSNAHLGWVGGKTKIVKVGGTTVGVNNTLYTTGDVLGTKLTLNNVFARAGGTAILKSIFVQDKTKQSTALDVIFFDSDPSNSTFTNNSALAIADADLDKVIGTVSIVAGDYVAGSDNSVATKGGLDVAMAPAAVTSSGLYAVLVTRGGPTYVNNELGISFAFRQD